MPLVPVAIPLASLTARSTLASAERLVNTYAEIIGTGPSAQAVLYRSPGLATWATAAFAPCRGMTDVNGTTLLVVHGQSLYGYNQSGVGTVWGSVPGTGRVVMATNAATPAQTILVSDGQVWVASSGSVVPYGDPDLPSGVVGVLWIDSYFIFVLADGRFFISGNNNTTVNALDFATAEADPDGLVAGASLQREVYLFGPKTIEIWTNTGAASFPFERLPGGSMPFGCSAPHSIAQVEQALYWIDDAGSVRRTSGGYATEDVASVSVVEAIRKVADRREIVGFAYKFGADYFYVIRHETFTWLLNTRTGFWHERASAGNAAWRVTDMRFFAGKNIVGSALDGSLFAIDKDVFDEGADPVMMVIQTPRMDAAPRGATVHELNIEIDTGHGRDDAGTDSDTQDPKLTLRWSDDGGKTFTGGRLLNLGRQGEYRRRVRTTRLGSFGEKGRIWRLEISSRVFISVLGMTAVVEPLNI